MNGDHSFNKRALDESDDSDDEADSDAGYDCSNVELVQDFLVGKAFTNYQMSLRHFIRAYKDKENTILISSFETNHNAIVEGTAPMSEREKV